MEHHYPTTLIHRGIGPGNLSGRQPVKGQQAFSSNKQQTTGLPGLRWGTMRARYGFLSSPTVSWGLIIVHNGKVNLEISIFLSHHAAASKRLTSLHCLEQSCAFFPIVDYYFFHYILSAKMGISPTGMSSVSRKIWSSVCSFL